MRKDIAATMSLKPWEGFAKRWELFTSPNRPSRQEIRLYERFLIKSVGYKRQGKILILGSTPELRDMLAKYPHLEVTLLDKSIEMILAMTNLMKQKFASRNEVWVCADWIDAPIRDHYFDVVLGDFVIGNIAPSLQPTFFLSIQHYLRKRKGVFITRELAYSKKYHFFLFEDLLRKYVDSQPTRQNINNFWTLAVFSGVSKDRVVRTFDIGKKIDSFRRKGRIVYKNRNIEKFLRGIDERLAPYDKKWSVDWQSRAEICIARFFYIIQKNFDSKSVLGDSAPVYLLRTRLK